MCGTYSAVYVAGLWLPPMESIGSLPSYGTDLENA